MHMLDYLYTAFLPWDNGYLAPNFFKFEKSGFQCCWFAPIVDPDYDNMARSTPELLVSEKEPGRDYPWGRSVTECGYQ